MTTTTSRISKKPDRCGGDACVRTTRIPVWGLVEGRRLGLSEARLLLAYPTLQSGDLEAAWDYARLNPLEIERNIWENQAVMEDHGGDRRLALIVRGWQLGMSDTMIGEAFSPSLSAADLQTFRRDYLDRKEAFDKALTNLLPEELREGLTFDGFPVR